MGFRTNWKGFHTKMKKKGGRRRKKKKEEEEEGKTKQRKSVEVVVYKLLWNYTRM